jgi:hypothetical protein
MLASHPAAGYCRAGRHPLSGTGSGGLRPWHWHARTAGFTQRAPLSDRISPVGEVCMQGRPHRSEVMDCGAKAVHTYARRLELNLEAQT